MKNKAKKIAAKLTVFMTIFSSLFSGAAVPSAGATGIVGWTAGGVIVAPNQNSLSRTGNQSNVRVIPDGSGGTWAVFEDTETGQYLVRLQHLNSSGVRQLGNQGVQVAATSGEQRSPDVVSDGGTGVYVVWKDFRNGNDWNVFAQRFDSSGAAQWTANGVGVATAAVNEEIFVERDISSVESDGSGNLYIAFRFNGTNGIKAQKLNSSGTAQWTAGGVTVTTTTVSEGGDIALDGAGGIFVSWTDQRNSPTTSSEVWAQRMDSSGTAGAAANGVQIGATVGRDNNQSRIVNSGSDAFIVWNSTRNAFLPAVFAQKVNSSVVAQWTANGVSIQVGQAYNQSALPDGSGGVFIATIYNPSNGNVHVHLVNGAGVKQWGADGTQVTSGVGNSNFPLLARDGAGGVIVEWIDNRGATKLFAQRLNSSGAVQWTANGISQSSFTGDPFSFVGDGAGTTYSGFASNGDAFAQKTDPSGSPQWTVNGARLQSTGGLAKQSKPRVVADGSGNYFYVWIDFRADTSGDLYAQKLNAEGVPQWASDGVAVGADPTGDQDQAFAVSDGAGGVIIVWSDGGDDQNVKAQRLDSNGSVHSGWTAGGVEVIAAPYPYVMDITSDGAGGAIVSAMDANEEKYIASRVTAAGTTPWGTVGLNLSDPANNCGLFDAAVTVADGAGGAYFAWAQEEATCSNIRMYITRRDADGSLHVGWTTNGNQVTNGIEPTMPTLVQDGSGGAVLAWVLNQGGGALMGQRYNGSGTAQWTANGVEIAPDNFDQRLVPQAVPTGTGGMALVWNEAGNIRAQKLDGSGALLWGASGIQLDLGNVYNSQIDAASDDAGGLVAVWSDIRSGIDVYGQRVNSAGTVEWTAGGIAVAQLPQSEYIYREGGSQTYGNTYSVVSNGAGGLVAAYGITLGTEQVRTQEICEDTCPTVPSTNDPTLSNRVVLSRIKAGVSSTANINFTLQNTLSGTLTVTFPVGFTVTAAATGGSACLSAFGFTSSTLTATKTNCSGAVSMTGATVTNPGSTGIYTITWVNDDPGSASVFIISEDQVNVTAVVDPVLTFNVGAQASATACAGSFAGNGGTVALGSLTTASVSSSDASSVNHICTRLTTNAANGAIVTVRSLNASLKSTSVPADTIPSSTTTLVAGTAGYGLCAGSAGADSDFDVTTPAGVAPARSAPFNGSCTSGAHDVGALTTSAQNIWTVADASQNAFVRIYIKASISSSTPAHSDYTDTLTFVATGTF